MPSTPSVAYVGIALLGNLVSGFSCGAPMPPLPTSSSLAFRLRYSIPPHHYQSTSLSSYSTNHHFHSRSNPLLQHTRITSNNVLTIRGGALLGASTTAGDNTSSSSQSPAVKDLTLTTGNILASLWGSCGVVYILVKAIKRVLPIAMEPFSKTVGVVPLTNFQLAAYILTCLWFAYVEGYKGFQRKFSPLVVSRSFTLQPATSSIHHLLLAPLYSMGLFHATKKRMIVSWSVSLGVAAIVAAVKRLPYPWRNIVDAGVVFGLTWGTISILGGYTISLITGIAPIDVDPELPDKKAQ